MPVKRDTEDVISKFRKVFTELNPPKGGLPTLPTKLSELDIDALGDLTSRYAAWREYAEDCHLMACATYSQKRSEYDLEVDKMMLRSNAATVTEKKSEARTSPKMEVLTKDLTEAEMLKDLFGSKLESFTNVLTVLSRELTRRGVYNT